jgi:VPDSG-CTERM motif
MKIKYIAAVLIAIAGFGLQHAKADTVTYTLSTANTAALGSGPFGTVDVNRTSTTTAIITFTAASGYLFVDGSAVDVNVNATSWTATGFSASPGEAVTSSGSKNVDGFGTFNQTNSEMDASNGDSVVSFTLTQTSGTPWASASQVLKLNDHNWLVAAHVFLVGSNGVTGFVAGPSGNGGFVPDGGTTVMLLGAALGALGMARRFLMS